MPSDKDPPGMSVAASGCAAGFQREFTTTEWSEGISWYCNADQMNVCGIENQSQDLFQCSGSETGTSLLQRKENTSSIVLRHPGTWSEKKRNCSLKQTAKTGYLLLLCPRTEIPLGCLCPSLVSLFSPRSFFFIIFKHPSPFFLQYFIILLYASGSIFDMSKWLSLCICHCSLLFSFPRCLYFEGISLPRGYYFFFNTLS